MGSAIDCSKSLDSQRDGIVEEDIKLNVEDEIREEPNVEMDHEEFEQYKKLNSKVFNEPGKEAKLPWRSDSITKIVWNFCETQQIIKNLLEKNRYFNNEETILG